MHQPCLRKDTKADARQDAYDRRHRGRVVAADDHEGTALMPRPCTLCSDRGQTAMCAQCRAEARAFYRDAPSITGAAYRHHRRRPEQDRHRQPPVARRLRLALPVLGQAGVVRGDVVWGHAAALARSRCMVSTTVLTLVPLSLNEPTGRSCQEPSSSPWS